MAKIQLTSDIATRLGAGWRELLPDETIASLVGVDVSVLKKWLADNEQVTYIRRFISKASDGTQVETRKEETCGLRDLKDREIRRLEADYLAKHSELIEMAKKENNIPAAIKAIQWRLEKAIPDKYGRDGTPGTSNPHNLPMID